MKKVWSRFISIPKRHDSLSFHPQSSNNFFIVISSLVELEREKTLRDLGTISPRVKTWGPRGESQVVFRRDENNLFFSFVSSPFFLSFFSFLFFSTSSFDVQNSKGVRVVPRWWSRFGKLAALLCCHSLARRQWIRFKSRRLARPLPGRCVEKPWLGSLRYFRHNVLSVPGFSNSFGFLSNFNSRSFRLFLFSPAIHSEG